MIEKIKNVIEGPLNEIGIMVDSIVYEQEGKNNFLRITIDKENPITIDDCVDAAHIINPILDEHDFIADSYHLEVMSKERGTEDNEQ